ncbi:flagellar basal body-associated FliL family protein [Erythrobacter sp.]|jgi:flagellar FliL protein|uniref:flagellar basal body-associated FliL family protein n=1 Tax=Erythrobacter sp. TaxID=1042 RepID=UPI002EA73AF4|nr:flagellar basal body-associated FliL family protein [Erythrobacter sp.]
MAAAEKSDKSETKGKGGIVKIALAMAAVLALGAGGAYGAFASGLLGSTGNEGPNEPQLVRKGESDPYEVELAGSGDAGPIVYGDGGSEYRTAYYSFSDSFTSNLEGGPALIQVDLAASTRRDGRVLQWLHNHELAIRSAILIQLAATSEEDIYSPDGKEQLSQRLAEAINGVLEQEEGFGGIDAVHFKGLLVQ